MSESRVIMISGASRGIGRAVAVRLRESGHRLSLGLRGAGESTGPLAAGDAARPEDAARWVSETVERFGRPDTLINSAGILRPFHIEDSDEGPLDEMLNINLKAPMRLIRAAMPHLRRCGQGRVINLVSMSGKRIKSQGSGYAISKFAMMALNHSIRNIGWQDGVRTTAICPGWVNTDMASVSSVKPEDMTQPEDLAELIDTLLRLPNTMAINEVGICCELEF